LNRAFQRAIVGRVTGGAMVDQGMAGGVERVINHGDVVFFLQAPGSWITSSD
jgi:hypothetical protein